MIRPRLPLSSGLALALCLFAHLAGGCAEGVDTVPIESGGSSEGGGETSGGASGGVEAPRLLEATPFSLVLKITWEIKSPCDSIEGERKTEVDPYQAIFEVPGTDTVYVDSEAAKDQAYTYRLRCFRGMNASAYSNEKTANPADL
jgi:hypothetical protein